MINRLRKALLLVVVFLLGLSGYYFSTDSKKAEPPVEIRMSEKDIDVAIENFKVIHEENGRKEWELNAKSAKINQEKKQTQMKQVQVKVDFSETESYWVSADSGVLQNETQDFDLMGNVRFTADDTLVVEQFKNKRSNQN